MRVRASIVLLLLVLHSSFAQDLTRRPELVFEGLWTSDILLTDSRLSYNQVTTNFEWTVGLAYGSIDLEYRPFRQFDFLTRPTELHRDRYSADVELRPRVTKDLLLLLSGNYYHGFSDYRAAWLDEYYRQSYEGITGYRKAIASVLGAVGLPCRSGLSRSSRELCRGRRSAGL